MNFKKDYLNYVLQNVITWQTGYSTLSGPGTKTAYQVNENIYIKKILEHIIKSDDFVKTTFLIGKTAGLELLFKYMLYISDKIDKSQVTIFNIKDNFDYDVQNLKKICEKIDSYYVNISVNRSGNGDSKDFLKKPSDSKIKIDLNTEKEFTSRKEEEQIDENEYDKAAIEDEGMTLIENKDTGSQEEAIFEVADIDEPEAAEKNEPAEIEISDGNDEIITEPEIRKKEIEEIDKLQTADTLSDLEFEVSEPAFDDDEFSEKQHVKEESVTNEAYLKFENKFFEDVKILEKLFYYVGKMSRQNSITKLSERLLQSITEIIEISSELSDLTRQLSFDLTADIFFTINLYFTKTIKNPLLLTYERIYLLESSLKLVNSLIKGENYLNYDEIVEQIENLKNELVHPAERKPSADKPKKPEPKFEAVSQIPETKQNIEKEEIQRRIESVNYEARKEAEKYKTEGFANKDDTGEAIFKIKYYVKEFEKTLLSIDKLKGEYSKFEALEKIDEINNLLRLIAKLSASVKINDVLKLSEVSYVFLKYLKDYRMDLLDPEIHRIIKYIISTFKMLLTEQKTEDFNKLVQYLNNPVKIFTDSN